MSASDQSLSRYMKDRRLELEERLDELVRAPEVDPGRIYGAMRYSLISGGKRLRAILMMLTADILVGSHAHVLDVACTLEMVHAYSLIHDDLPCMDNDDMRRGRPTNHRVFGEATAVLAGDGLLTLAFATLASIPVQPPVTASGLLQCIAEIGFGAGPEGMVGGQALDIAVTGDSGVTLDVLKLIHQRKTGALFRSAVRASAMLCGANETVIRCLGLYSEALGLAFQIGDDILDVLGDQERMGKRTGADAHQGKASYPAVVGLDESRRLLNEAVLAGRRALSEIGLGGTLLYELLDYVADRDC